MCVCLFVCMYNYFIASFKQIYFEYMQTYLHVKNLINVTNLMLINCNNKC